VSGADTTLSGSAETAGGEACVPLEVTSEPQTPGIKTAFAAFVLSRPASLRFQEVWTGEFGSLPDKWR